MKAKKFMSLTLVITLLGVGGFALARGHEAAAAESVAQGPSRSVEIAHAWARLDRDNKRRATIYFEIANRSDIDETLVSVWTPLADKAALAAPRWEGMRMFMERVDSLEIPAGGEVTLRPGAYQVDVVQLSRRLHPGQTIPLEIRFARAGRMEIRAEISNKLLPDHLRRRKTRAP